MLPTERADFDTALTKLMGLFNRQVDAEQRDIWWSVLRGYDFGSVRRAMLDYTKEKQHAPTPAAIRAVIGSAKAPADVAPAKQTHWTSKDLICAAHFAEVRWPERYGGMRDPMAGRSWVDRVAQSYDAGLAEAAERIVGKRPDLSPTDAAREFLAGYARHQPKGWFLPLNDAVPM